jgi:hypothetical protein
MNMNDFPRYTTKTGLKIGGHYTPPYINRMSPEEERIQRAMLGIREDICVMIEKVVYYMSVFMVACIVVYLLAKPDA